MFVKKSKWYKITRVLFTWLAISKILYWSDMLAYHSLSGFENALQSIATRLIGQDLGIVLTVMVIYYMEDKIRANHQKGKRLFQYLKMYALVYLATFAISAAGIWIFSLINEDAVFQPSVLPLLFLGGLIMFVIIVGILELKEYLKEKNNPPVNDHLVMLEMLHRDGVLTDGEFEEKKELIT